MKKLLSLVLTLVFVCSAMASATAVNFPDVDKNYDWAQDAIETLSEQKVITGYEDGTFKPGKTITRQEAITLLSKALGASEEVNAPIVNLAYGIFEVSLAGCEDSYAVKPGAYLIYRKVLTPDEVQFYLSKETRDIELKRYEAATIIAKALGADPWLKNNSNFDVTFKDKDEIPAAALGYVYYATALGIMNGMGDDLFAPNETVTRAQIAVMISRILDTMDFQYVHGMIASVDTLMNNLSIKTAEGEVLKFGVGNSSPVYLDGEKVSLVDLDVGMECVFIFSRDAIYQIDAITYEGEEVVSGAYRGKTTTNAGTTIKLEDIDAETPTLSSYKLASNCVFNINDGKGAFADVKMGDYVTITMSGGLGISFTSVPREVKIYDLTLTNIDTSSDGVKLVVENRNEETFTYALTNDATINRNGAKAEFADLAIGDALSVTLDYGKISAVVATGKQKSTQGTITEITISQGTSYISISSDGRTSKYPMARDCEILVDGKAVTAYDLRLGAYIKLTVASETVTKIETEAVSEALSITGTIKSVTPSYGFIVVSYTNQAGMEVEQQLFVKDNAKILDARNNKVLSSIKDLKVGNVITVAGVQKLNMYEVSSIMVLQ